MKRTTSLAILFLFMSVAQGQDNVVTLRAPDVAPGGIAYILPESQFDSLGCQVRLVSADIKGDVAEIVRRSDCQPHAIPAIVCDHCDWTVRKVWKEIYKVQGDKLVFQKRIDGKIIPPQPERIEWPDALDTSAKTITAWAGGDTGDSAFVFVPEKPAAPKRKKPQRKFAHAQNGGTLPSIEHQKEFQQQLQVLQEAQRAVQLADANLQKTIFKIMATQKLSPDEWEPKLSNGELSFVKKAPKVEPKKPE